MNKQEFIEYATNELVGTDLKKKIVLRIVCYHVGDEGYPIYFDPKKLNVEFEKLESALKDLASEFHWVLWLNRKKERTYVAFTTADIEKDKDDEVIDHSGLVNPDYLDEEKKLQDFRVFDGPTFLCKKSIEKRALLIVLMLLQVRLNVVYTETYLKIPIIKPEGKRHYNWRDVGHQMRTQFDIDTTYEEEYNVERNWQLNPSFYNMNCVTVSPRYELKDLELMMRKVIGSRFEYILEFKKRFLWFRALFSEKRKQDFEANKLIKKEKEEEKEEAVTKIIVISKKKKEDEKLPTIPEETEEEEEVNAPAGVSMPLLIDKSTDPSPWIIEKPQGD